MTNHLLSGVTLQVPSLKSNRFATKNGGFQ